MSLQSYLDETVGPEADQWDREERIPRGILRDLAGFGIFGAHLPLDQGGGGLPVEAWGEQLEAVGAASMSLLSVVTVHAMCSFALARWGEPAAQAEWLPALARGARLGGFGLTEPSVGSDAKSVTTRLEDAGDGWRITGTKRWISAAESADLFLVLGRTDDGPTAVLVPRESPGVSVMPIGGMLGFRAARPCEIRFNGVLVPKRWTIGPVGQGFAYVAASALDVGRFCIACGSTGLIGACVRASVDYARDRRQFGQPLAAHQLVQAQIADMTTTYRAARALWRAAARSRQEAAPGSIMETTTAKYFASTGAARAANDAVQVHGANGCGPGFPVQRYFRDARITELIEGSNQLQQVMIAQDALAAFASRRRS